MRTASVSRVTGETRIELKINLDAKGKANVKSGVGFLDHMLELFCFHSGVDILLRAQGDTHVDFHHTVEDVGIALGQAFLGALGEKKGIARYGSILLPMDEALCMVALDISGRAHLSFDAVLPAQKVGTFDTELVKEFFAAFVREAEITLHIRSLVGENTHHIIEGMFKGVARALAQAVKIDPSFAEEIPSTKGTLGGNA